MKNIALIAGMICCRDKGKLYIRLFRYKVVIEIGRRSSEIRGLVCSPAESPDLFEDLLAMTVALEYSGPRALSAIQNTSRETVHETDLP